MQTFKEYLNRPDLLESWKKVETVWDEYLRELHDHLRDNLAKYDAYHTKFGNLSNEHPDHYLDGIVREIEKDFKKMQEAIKRLGAHDIV